METHSWPAEEKQAFTAPAADFSTFGAGQHDHRVLAAELERAADQPVGRLPRDQRAGGGGSGEADVVGALDDRGAHDRARAADDLPHVGREPGVAQQLDAGQGDQRALAVGLVHDGVAGRDGRQAVGDGHRERVVPGADDADDALGHVVDPHRGEAGQRAGATLGLELATQAARIEARREGEVGDLVERVRSGTCRTRPGSGRAAPPAARARGRAGGAGRACARAATSATR